MIPWLLQRSTLKHLARVSDGSRCCRSFLAAMVAVDDVSGTRYGSHGFWVTKMMCTAANGTRRNKREKRFVVLKNSGPDAYLEKDEDEDEYPWKWDLDYFSRKGRSDLEIKSIFETWIMLFGKVYASAIEKERRFAIFKCKVRFIEEKELTSRNLRLWLDYFSDMTPREYFAMKDPTNLSDEEDVNLMSTSAGMGRNAGENDQISIGEKMKDSGAVLEESSEPSPPSLKEKEFYCLRDFPSWRSKEELRLMFEEWNTCSGTYYASKIKRKRQFKIFKERVRFIEEMTARNLGCRLKLDSFGSMTLEHYFREKTKLEKFGR